MIETLDLIGKGLCIFLAAMLILFTGVAVAYLILNFGNKVDAVERKRGKWVHSEDEAWSGGGKTTCSACAWSYSDGAYLDVYEFNFCPNCGAEMKER